MSSDNQNNPTDMNHRRRGSVTQQALAGLFRSNSTTAGSGLPTGADANRRRLSIATTGIGLAGTSPTNPSAFNGFRRGSVSTSSESIDENAIDEEETSRTAPITPFTRRMSFGASAMRMRNGNGSPGSNDQGFNWSEQLRSRAESSVSGARPSFSFGSSLSTSPPRPVPQMSGTHDRAKSVSEMPAPPVQTTVPKAPEPQRKKPDAFQERILKGDFYMD